MEDGLQLSRDWESNRPHQDTIKWKEYHKKDIPSIDRVIFSTAHCLLGVRQKRQLINDCDAEWYEIETRTKPSSVHIVCLIKITRMMSLSLT